MKTIRRSIILRSFKRKTTFLLFLLALGCTLLPAFSFAQDQPKLADVGTTKSFGKVYGIEIEGMVQSPSEDVIDLQTACVFEYVEGDIFNPPALPEKANGLRYLDKAFGGLITELRKSGKFTGQRFETILITPPSGTIKAKQLLLVGMGDRNIFDPEIMKTIGKIEMREALRLGVKSYCHASDIKDAGIDSPTGLVVKNVLSGALDAYSTELYLKEKGMAEFKPLQKLRLVAGQAYFDVSGQAIEEVINTYNK